MLGSRSSSYFAEKVKWVQEKSYFAKSGFLLVWRGYGFLHVLDIIYSSDPSVHSRRKGVFLLCWDTGPGRFKMLLH